MIAKEISSLQHPLVKHWVRLRSSSTYRYREKGLLATGENIFSELSGRLPFKRLIVQKEASHAHSFPCEELFLVTEDILKKITGLVQPQPIAVELPLPHSADLTSASRLLVLDNVSDPGNLGTLLRSALAFGWDGAFVLGKSADPFNDKALRASKGAVFRLPLAWGDEDAFHSLLSAKKWEIFGADMKGKPLHAIAPPSPPFMLVLGNEAKGLSPFIKERSTLLSLPMAGEMESLNVAIAGSIFMHLLQR